MSLQIRLYVKIIYREIQFVLSLSTVTLTSVSLDNYSWLMLHHNMICSIISPTFQNSSSVVYLFYQLTGILMKF